MTPTKQAVEAARERLAKAAEAEGLYIDADHYRAGDYGIAHETQALAIALQEMSDAVGTALGSLPDNPGRVWRELLEDHFNRFILPEPVDPLLIEAREWAARDAAGCNMLKAEQGYREGAHDDAATIRAYIAGRKAVQS